MKLLWNLLVASCPADKASRVVVSAASAINMQSTHSSCAVARHTQYKHVQLQNNYCVVCPAKQSCRQPCTASSGPLCKRTGIGVQSPDAQQPPACKQECSVVMEAGLNSILAENRVAPQLKHSSRIPSLQCAEQPTAMQHAPGTIFCPAASAVAFMPRPHGGAGRVSAMQQQPLARQHRPSAQHPCSGTV